MTPNELLPCCPFCHSKSIPMTSRHTTRCELLTVCAGGMNEIPVEYWNNRVKSPRERELEEALKDMLSGWKYIREVHGDLYGVGWDRAQTKAESALKGEG